MREVEFYFLCGPLFAAIQYVRGTRPRSEKSPRTGRGQVQQGGWWQ